MSLLSQWAEALQSCDQKSYHIACHEGQQWQWRIQGGGAQQARPPKIGSTVICITLFCIRMLKNRAQIALESIKNPRASRALKGALIPAERDFGFRARNVRSRI